MMKLLTRGNKKLDKSIFGFSLTPVKSCRNCSQCKDSCYAIGPYKRYPNCKKAWDRNYDLAKSGEFATHIIDQLSRAKNCKTVRIHVAGDFFSETYVWQWAAIATKFPNIKFYTYTKMFDLLNFSILLNCPNVNVINSITFDGGVNFGDEERVKFLQSHGYKLCPATIKKNDVVCGKDCSICISESKVCFLEH